MDLIFEPPDLFQRRQEQKHREIDAALAQPTEHPSGWDEAIMRFFIAQPGVVMLFMRAVNALVKHCRPRCNRDRELAKIEIIHALGRLIRQRKLVRVRRGYVRVHEGEVPHAPIIRLEDFRRMGHTLGGNPPAGSTMLPKVIHPSVFI